MKALVTGAEGFVGPYLISLLRSKRISTTATYFSSVLHDPQCVRMDVTRLSDIEAALAQSKPDYIFHLAGFSSVAASFSNPDACRKINIEGTRNLLEASISLAPQARILVVSSAEVYGNPLFLPITEKHPVSALSPYAESRIEQEQVCKEYIDQLHILISRSFNHVGPGQSEAFALSSFAKQIVMIEKKGQRSLKVGNLEAIRDFSDVRDVVRAYFLLLKRGQRGATYNTCSGRGHSIKDLLKQYLNSAMVHIPVEVDQSRMRPADIPVLVGDNSMLRKGTGWKPKISIKRTLQEILEYWRKTILTAKES